MKTFIISDLHMNHTNILRYCDRPFNSVEEMNRTLVYNWNNAVSEGDMVYYLGDMAIRNIDKWLQRLNGNIIFIQGNHDDRGHNALLYHKLEYKGHKFLLIHDPRGTEGFDCWVIHGHKHNNNTIDYPFINFKNKTVNVSCELIDYTPIDLNRVLNLIS